MSRKVLIATHGELARGFKSAVQILVGTSYDIETINAYIPEEPDDYTPRIRAFIDGIGAGDEGVIFTDLFGGSVNQKVIQTYQGTRDNVFLVTETNLMTIIAVLLEGRPLSETVMEEIVSQARAQVVKFDLNQQGGQEDAEAFLG